MCHTMVSICFCAARGADTIAGHNPGAVAPYRAGGAARSPCHQRAARKPVILLDLKLALPLWTRQGVSVLLQNNCPRAPVAHLLTIGRVCVWQVRELPQQLSEKTHGRIDGLGQHGYAHDLTDRHELLHAPVNGRGAARKRPDKRLNRAKQRGTCSPDQYHHTQLYMWCTHCDLRTCTHG